MYFMGHSSSLRDSLHYHLCLPYHGCMSACFCHNELHYQERQRHRHHQRSIFSCQRTKWTLSSSSTTTSTTTGGSFRLYFCSSSKQLKASYSTHYTLRRQANQPPLGKISSLAKNVVHVAILQYILLQLCKFCRYYCVAKYISETFIVCVWNELYCMCMKWIVLYVCIRACND